MTNLRVPLKRSDSCAQWQNPCDTKRSSSLLVIRAIYRHCKVYILCECPLTSGPGPGAVTSHRPNSNLGSGSPRLKGLGQGFTGAKRWRNMMPPPPVVVWVAGTHRRADTAAAIAAAAATTPRRAAAVGRFGRLPAPAEVATDGAVLLQGWPGDGWLRGTVVRCSRAQAFSHGPAARWVLLSRCPTR